MWARFGGGGEEGGRGQGGREVTTYSEVSQDFLRIFQGLGTFIKLSQDFFRKFPGLS